MNTCIRSYSQIEDTHTQLSLIIIDRVYCLKRLLLETAPQKTELLTTKTDLMMMTSILLLLCPCSKLSTSSNALWHCLVKLPVSAAKPWQMYGSHTLSGARPPSKKAAESVRKQLKVCIQLPLGGSA